MDSLNSDLYLRRLLTLITKSNTGGSVESMGPLSTACAETCYVAQSRAA